MTHAPGPAPRVSVPMVTFQHERFVGEAIESVLAQDLPDWEIVVGDDASTDGTIAVVQSYLGACEWQGRQRLRILDHEHKIGPRQNYMRTLSACRGEYLSQLDGDDTFVDESKLSRQARFLDEHPDCSGVFGAWLETDLDGANGVLTPGFGLDGRDRFEAQHFGPYCMTTSSAVMFRRGLFGDFPDWYTEAEVGDWPLHLLNTVHGGPYAYVDQVVSTHRNHNLGVWTQRSSLDQVQSTVRTQDLFLRVLPADVGQAMIPHMLGANWARAEQHRDRGEFEAARTFLRWCLAHPTKDFRRWRVRKALLRLGWMQRFGPSAAP